MKTRFDALAEEFQQLELDQLKKGEIEARQKLEKANESFAEKRSEFERQLSRAGKVSDEAWDDVNDALQTAWADIRQAVDHARKDFAGEVKADSSSSS